MSSSPIQLKQAGQYKPCSKWRTSYKEVGAGRISVNMFQDGSPAQWRNSPRTLHTVAEQESPPPNACKTNMGKHRVLHCNTSLRVGRIANIRASSPMCLLLGALRNAPKVNHPWWCECGLKSGLHPRSHPRASASLCHPPKKAERRAPIPLYIKALAGRIVGKALCIAHLRWPSCLLAEGGMGTLAAQQPLQHFKGSIIRKLGRNKMVPHGHLPNTYMNGAAPPCRPNPS